MKHESGFKNTDQSDNAEDENLRSMIGQTMSPKGGTDMSMSAGGPKKAPEPGKVNVIPLRQEDIDSCDGDVKRKRVMIVLVVVLSVVLGLIITRSFGVSFKGDQMPQKAGSFTDKKAVSDSSIMSIWKVPGKISKTVRDITKSSDKQSELPKPVGLAGVPELPVRGIVIYNNDNRSAIVGGMVVKIGDTIKGVKIHMINIDSVVFEKDGVRWSGNVE